MRAVDGFECSVISEWSKAVGSGAKPRKARFECSVISEWSKALSRVRGGERRFECSVISEWSKA